MLYSRLAVLPLTIDSFELEGLSSQTAAGWTRHTTVIHLQGAGLQGSGEDISYEPEDQLDFQDRGRGLALPGKFDLRSFSRHLDALPLFAKPPSSPGNVLYRRWALESAALDLALQQAGTTLAKTLGRELAPLQYVVSLGLGNPPSDTRLREILERFPGLGFKVDLAENWTPDTPAMLQRVGGVTTVDLKGHYHGNFTGPRPDPVMYRAVAEQLPNAWIEDPWWQGEAWDALAPHRDRITWDAVLHSVADLMQLPAPPRCINIKPSRFGFLSELFRCYEYCETQGIAMYGGGQFELGVGRDQIQYLASLFHPQAANDVAPRGFNLESLPAELPASPLQPQPAATGFGWRS